MSNEEKLPVNNLKEMGGNVSIVDELLPNLKKGTQIQLEQPIVLEIVSK